jgi:ribosome modulation factor
MVRQSDEDVLKEGEAAYERGLSHTRCPYPPETMEHVSWTKGWRKADQLIVCDNRPDLIPDGPSNLGVRLTRRSAQPILCWQADFE